MEKIFLLILTIFIDLVVHGQESKILIGFDIQPTISSLYGSDYLKDFDKRISFSGGLDLEFVISDHTSIKSGIYYDRKGITSDVYVVSSQVNSSLTISYDYITFPVLATISTKGKTKIFGSAGPSFGYLTSQRYMVKGTNVTPELNQDNTSNSNRLDIGITFGTGLKIPLSEKVFFGVEIRNNIGLINTNKIYGRIEKTNICSLLIGLRFKA
jgi:hypothetical protein